MIAPADIEAIRERAQIAEVVGDYVSLRAAGHDRLTGLCPFHDERTPSFQVTPSRGFYHCFGCGESGDIYRFIQNMEHVGFVEAVEMLADRIKFQLTRVDDTEERSRDRGTKRRLLSANEVAAEFYAARLMLGEEAAPAREFLKGRGFDRELAERFGCGFAPRGWDHLVRHLRSKGFAESEMEEAGLARKGQRGLVDRFRGRLLWPIRNASREVIGFGARRIFEDDDGPKYLNTPETKLYKKSQVLFGLDQAKRDIAAKHQVVVVEGYTDVMAMHAAGVPTAVASCGTAFGSEHIGVIRRLLLDDNSRGEVIYTFDGDDAGKAAALKAWEGDQSLVAQTFVALMPEKLDPCDTRLQLGEEALRELVAKRVPLLEFATRAAIAEFDLATAEGRVGALRRTVPMVAKIKDVALRDEYARQLAGWVGWEDTAQVLHRVREESGEKSARRPSSQGGGPAPRTQRRPSSARDWSQRESLKALLQHPKLAAEQFAGVSPTVFALPDYRAIRDGAMRAIDSAPGLEGHSWVQAVREQTDDERLRTLVAELAVEPIATSHEQMPRYVGAVLARLELFDVEDQIAELKSELSRSEGAGGEGRVAEVFGELVALESYRRALQKQVNGEDGLPFG
ncbi:DNA primase [Segniliparus rugosus]|uniref:DNA primase n=1 Tax=Segniliparus rugosus (strain ATCC BAA-974 / DSM 45345 / CCUG 50838 / CIP 108380 / JCM 13579 / CDC 945) TaxID=679197 RepID=E5XNP0_SEGRC|nr:DNA primase [Segniliparus rugosus]EFV14030.1 DNA primase [Segniliparus rugosus ATCC BAA-974]